MKVRAKVKVRGIVQGVGFRPFIYGLARSYLLNGWVLNSTEGVSIEVEGEKELLSDFIENIRLKSPPLAKIDSLDVEYLPPVNYETFIIRHSEGDKGRYMKISPDVCICDDCLRELFDPQDRRYRYPFINCTNCGPRFTIVKDIPYDRENTTMHKFKMCPACQAEYDDPANRRFHAQPNACAVCGPSVSLESLHGKESCADPIRRAIELLCDGKIIAVKGLGGFHLACDAENDHAVRTLRERKRRTFKPFAIMSATPEKIKRYCSVSEEESKLLLSVQRPIVLLKKLSNCPISEFVAPNNNYLGVMLPYTPLHYLLLDSPLLALVMTSGNISEEPLAYDNEEAKRRLADLADYFLTHDRDIRIRCDDSVARIQQGHPVMIRRSRGYAPHPVDMDFSMEEILACGAELKNTFCFTKDNHAFISHHIGDLQNLETYQYYQDCIEHYKKLFRVEPKIIAYDLHPDYLSTKYALAQDGLPTLGVQHHHAHVVSCMAENSIAGQVIGVACDGTGYGTDGTIWGCEFLIAGMTDFRRYAHLKYVPLPGGDSATKEPARSAISYLYASFGEGFVNIDTPLLKRLDKKKVMLIKRMIENNINAPLTSSCGRLFDAISSIIGVRDDITYEAQAAIELEMISAEGVSEIYDYELQNPPNPLYKVGKDRFWGIEIDETIDHKGLQTPPLAKDHNTFPPLAKGGRGDLSAPNLDLTRDLDKEPTLVNLYNGETTDPFNLSYKGGTLIINVEEMIRQIVSDLNRGIPKGVISAKFHNTVADFIVAICKRIRAESGIDRVCLSGGTFQNAYLAERVHKRLSEEGFTPYFHKKVPTNDGGISLGQAVIANFRMKGDQDVPGYTWQNSEN